MPIFKGKRYAYTRRGRAEAAKAKEAAKKTATKKTAPKKSPVSKKTNPRAAAVKSKGNVNTATNRNFDASPGKTNQNPRARALSLKKDVTGGVKTKAGTYKTYKKNSTAAKDFRSAFAAAKKKGYKTFTWNNKKYNTKTK